MLKKIILFALMIAMLPAFAEVSAAETLSANDITAEAAVLIDSETGDILFEKDSSKKLGMASTTKIMTGILAIENCRLDDIVTISRHASYTEGSSIYTKEGEKISVETLIYGLLLKSGNDAAAALAEHMAGSEEAFADMMNEKAKKLGLKNTHFVNPHGLYDPDHYTTAYELAMLARYAMKNKTFAEIVNTVQYIEETNEARDKHIVNNANKLIKMYEEADGIKPGYTPETGRTLVGSATKNGWRVITVTLNCADDWNEHKKMFDYAFENYHLVTVAVKGESVGTYRVKGGDFGEVGAVLKKGLKVAVKNDEADTYKIKLDFEKLNAPIKKGMFVENARIEMANGNKYEVPVVTNGTVKRKERNVFKLMVKVFLSLFGG